MPWISVSHATKMSLKKRKILLQTHFCKEYCAVTFCQLKNLRNWLTQLTKWQKWRIIITNLDVTTRKERYHSFHTVRGIPLWLWHFNSKGITSEYLCQIRSLNPAVLRLDTGQLNQFFPLWHFSLHSAAALFFTASAPSGFPNDVLLESLSSWRICTRTAGKPAPPDFDEGNTCTAFFYIISSTWYQLCWLTLFSNGQQYIRRHGESVTWERTHCPFPISHIYHNLFMH